MVLFHSMELATDWLSTPSFSDHICKLLGISTTEVFTFPQSYKSFKLQKSKQPNLARLTCNTLYLTLYLGVFFKSLLILIWEHNKQKPSESCLCITHLQNLEPCQAGPAVLVLLTPQSLSQTRPCSETKSTHGLIREASKKRRPETTT